MVPSVDGRIDEFRNDFIDDYPLYGKSAPLSFDQAGTPLPIEHIMESQDHIWSVTICSSFISVTTSKYIDWADYRKRIEPIVNKAISFFDIKKSTRIGLRYINAIRPSSIGLGKPEECIRERYSGLITGNLGNVVNSQSILEYFIENNIRGRTVYGTIVFNDGEKGMLIDNDVYLESNYPIEKLMSTLDDFNSKHLSLFKEIASKEVLSEVI